MKTVSKKVWFAYIMQLGIPFIECIHSEISEEFLDFYITQSQNELKGSFNFKRKSVLRIEVENSFLPYIHPHSIIM